MIDIIVVGDDNQDIYKTLFSIYIQTIRDKIKVILISNKKHANLSFFREKIEIEEIVTKEKSLGKRRQIGISKANGEYVVFMRTGDCFFDVFALNNMYRVRNDNDAVIGGIENNSKKFSNYYLVGNLYRRKYLTTHHIVFRDGDGLENGFHQLFFMSQPKIIYSKNIIYHEMSPINNKSSDLLLNMVQDTLFAIQKAKIRSYSNRQIAKMAYDALLQFAYYLKDNIVFEDALMEELKKLVKEYFYYQKSMLKEDFQYVSSINLTNEELDKNYFKKLLDILV